MARTTATKPRSRGRTYLGASAEARRAARRQRLLEAALELLGTSGWNATTMRAVCTQAGLTQRYFYESFTDREDLVTTLFDEVAGEAQQAARDTLAQGTGDGPARARALVDSLVTLTIDDPRKGRVLLLEAPESPALRERRRRTLSAYVELVASTIEDDPAHPRPTPQQRAMTARAVVGALTEVLMGRLRGEIDVPHDELVDYATATILRLARFAGG